MRRLLPDDFQITDARYGVTLTLYRCRTCSFIFADDDEVRSLTGFYEKLVDPDYEITNVSRALQMQWLLAIGRRVHPAARSVLEIGAASGLLVGEALRQGLEATGVEPSRSLVEAAERLNGVSLICGTFAHPALSGRRFDLIYVIDVIDHVTEPVQLLPSLKSALSPGGLVIVTTPNINSLIARILRQRWWHLRLAHVGYFTPRSFQQ